VLTRGEAAHQPGVNVVLWHPNGRADIWARTLDGADVVVNLAGAIALAMTMLSSRDTDRLPAAAPVGPDS